MDLRTVAVNWPAPMVSDDGQKVTKASHQMMLCNVAEQFFDPSSFQGPLIAAGATSSTNGPNSNQPFQKKKLNPIFVEALMRWPTGLSGFARPATVLTPWLQQQRGFVLALCSSDPAEQGVLL